MDLASDQKCVMIIVGETSGDLHGSKLVRAMRERDNALFFCGIGGPTLKEAGVKILVDAAMLSAVGFTEMFSKLPNQLRGLALAKKLLESFRPDLLILIDFPEFNLRVAPTAKKLGIPVLYYISPQVWAWRSGRVKIIKKFVDRMAVILPFEEKFYKKHGIPVTFVGHPLLDTHLTSVDTILERKSENHPTIGLLPGSRDKEIARHLPLMLDAVELLKGRIENLEIIISLAPSVAKQYVADILEKHQAPAALEFLEDDVTKVFEKSSVVIAASGTVTLEAAINGIPPVIIYKISPVSYWLAKILVRVKNVGLVNLIAEKEIAPELIQNDASPLNIADTVYEMLSDPANLKALRKRLFNLRDVLGGSGASRRVADIAMDMLQNS